MRDKMLSPRFTDLKIHRQHSYTFLNVPLECYMYMSLLRGFFIVFVARFTLEYSIAIKTLLLEYKYPILLLLLQRFIMYSG